MNNGGGGGIKNKIIISEITHANVGGGGARECVFYSHTSFETLPENKDDN